MKTKIIGAITGLLLGVGLLVSVPTVAQALSWTNYISGTASVGIKQSGAGKVYQNRGRIHAPGGGVGYTARFTVKVASPKGNIISDGSTLPGSWHYQTVTSPLSNTIARCELVGAYHPSGGNYLCDVYK